MAQLAQLADAEAAEMKERHRARDAAIRRYEAAHSAIVEAEKALVAARQEQAEAIGALLASGLDTTTVGALLGIDARRVREARAAKRERNVEAHVRPKAPVVS